MVARRSIVALVATVGVSLQGCNEIIQGHIKSFIELTCSMNVDKLVDEVEGKWAEELGKQCQRLKDAAQEQGVSFEQKCLDEGAEVIDEEKKAAAANYTKACVDELSEATSGKEFTAVKAAVEKFIADWTPNADLGDSIKNHLNQTLGHIQDEANKAVDGVKDDLNKHIDDAKDKLKDKVDAVSDSLGSDKEAKEETEAPEETEEQVEETRLFAMVRLPGTSAGSSTVACLAGAALLAAAGLVVVARRASRHVGAEQREAILASDQELGE